MLDKKEMVSDQRGPGTMVIPIYVSCPRCHHDLMDNDVFLDGLPSIRLVAKIGPQTGKVFLSARYGSFDTRTQLHVQEDEVTSFRCPHCDGELPSYRQCSNCQAPLLNLDLLTGGAIEFCSRKGCRQHQLEFKEAEDLMHLYEKMHFDYSPAP